MKEFDFSKVKSYKFYKFMGIVIRIYCKIAYRIKFIGLENIPKNKGYILACNHIYYLDPGFIGASLVPDVHCMAKAETFEKPILNTFVTHLNSFPVKRGASDRTSLKFAIKVIEEGHALGIFPEGTRSKDGKPQEAKAGIALIAKAAKADVLPLAICYDKYPIKPFKTKITVRFGEVIPYESLGINEGKSSELRNAAQLIMDNIITLYEKGGA
ncbi:MAG: 1-acyl-sn-glycerol-3-phosphate acyltransferase [Clostridiales bacterium]|nr:1-acyl-sn-glycerol-3-phosphate acyltransferase [Clostridiales bacterium]